MRMKMLSLDMCVCMYRLSWLRKVHAFFSIHDRPWACVSVRGARACVGVVVPVSAFHVVCGAVLWRLW